MGLVQEMQEMAPVIAVDGPSGVGKGTLCGWLARTLGWHLLDSGSLYRVTALAAQRAGIGLDDESRVADLARHLDIRFDVDDDGAMLVFLGTDNVTAGIRVEPCGDAASRVAASRAVRQALLQRQRDFREAPGLVADGRDMGTVVFPDAVIKVFLTASAEQRALRRYNQLKGKGIGANLEQLTHDIAERDRRDAQRSVSPLQPAEDAHVLDTTHLSIGEVEQRVMAIVVKRIRLA
jgi:cytidylate kinase